MNLIYILIALTGPAPQDRIALYQTTEPNRCEAIVALLGKGYECQTMVLPRNQEKL